jgi:hypothetical protein
MDFSETDAATTEEIVNEVHRGNLTPAMGRDTARCMALEAHAKVSVYTLAKDSQEGYRGDRHVDTDFSKKQCMNAIRSVLKEQQVTGFQQVVLDYFWMPVGYLRVQKGLGTLLEGLAVEFFYVATARFICHSTCHSTWICSVLWQTPLRTGINTTMLGLCTSAI